MIKVWALALALLASVGLGARATLRTDLDTPSALVGISARG